MKAMRLIRPRRNAPAIGSLLTEGQEIVVQVSKDPIASKGPRLTSPGQPGRALPCLSA